MTTLRSLIADARYEVIPLKNLEAQLEHIPAEASVSVTCSFAKGQQTTLDLTRRIQDLGHMAVPHFSARLTADENAVRDLRHDCSDGRIKTCIVKQINLIEAMAKKGPGVTEQELSGMCNQIALWPHGAIKASLKSLYGFACDYPGIRHGGNPKGALRAIDMRDMVAVSILLAGFTPYLSNALDADIVYRGA
jgi:hypothetical protein